MRWLRLLGAPSEEKDHFFLKTVIPSRKATRDYIGQGEQMPKTDPYESDLIAAFEKGALGKSVATKAELSSFEPLPARRQSRIAG